MVKWDESCGEAMVSLDKNQTWKLIRRPRSIKLEAARGCTKLKSGIPGVEKLRFKKILSERGY